MKATYDKIEGTIFLDGEKFAEVSDVVIGVDYADKDAKTAVVMGRTTGTMELKGDARPFLAFARLIERERQQEAMLLRRTRYRGGRKERAAMRRLRVIAPHLASVIDEWRKPIRPPPSGVALRNIHSWGNPLWPVDPPAGSDHTDSREFLGPGRKER